eukprot:1217919-Rhodomonas_salina.1
MSESRRSSAQFESRRNSQQHLDASSSQSRFRHLLDANPLYNTAPASTPGFNQPSFGAPWTHITQQQQQQQQQHITQQQQRFAASQHALPEHGFGAAMAGASHLVASSSCSIYPLPPYEISDTGIRMLCSPYAMSSTGIQVLCTP